jgi:hypothetical protein
MPLPYRKLIIVSTLFLISIFFSCAKKNTDAGKVVGTYTGNTWIGTGLVNNYIVKIEYVKKDKVRISCQSAPAIFSTFEVNVSSINGVITTTGVPNVNLQYYPDYMQLSLDVGSSSFMGYKQ